MTPALHHARPRIRIVLSVVTILAALAFAACSAPTPAATPNGTGPTATAATSPAPARPTTTSSTAPPTSFAGESEGAFVFRGQCAGCHGTKGEGNVGPPLTGIADRMSPADELAQVRNGKAQMPSFSPGLSDAEIAAVIDYTRTQLG